jgi:hypothetical protein
MEPVATAVDDVYVSAERYLQNRLSATRFGLDLIAETAGFIAADLGKFREEQKTEIIVSTLNMLYKSPLVKTDVANLSEESRQKIEKFMTEALPHYIAMLNEPMVRRVRLLPWPVNCFNCYSRSSAVAMAVDPAVVSLAVRRPESSPPEDSPPSETRQAEVTYEKDAIPVSVALSQ